MEDKKKVKKIIEWEECPKCDGVGRVDCPHCGSPEGEECENCNGTGEVEKEEEEE